MLKSLLSSTLLFGSILFLTSSFQLKNTELNPTGTYEYDHGNNGNGKVKVQKLSQNKIKVSVFVVGGPPSHNMGEFMEELTITNGVAKFTSEECSIKFEFSTPGVKVTQIDGSCDFGNGIYANGYYVKKSSAVPNMDDAY
jgi:hypothetical protein